MIGGMTLEIRKLRADALPVPQILSLMEIYQGISLTRPDWPRLKDALSRHPLWGFFHGEELIGYALVNEKTAYFQNSIQLVDLRYRWQYNQEATVAWMLRAIGEAYQGQSAQMVLDIDLWRDLNRQLYQKLGFQKTIMRSPMGQDHGVFIASLDTLLTN